jgi:hypothetical protein
VRRRRGTSAAGAGAAGAGAASPASDGRENPRNGAADPSAGQTDAAAAGTGDTGADGTATDADAAGSGRRAPAAERRRAALLLVEIWRSVARDLAVLGLGEATSVRDPGLLEDLAVAATSVPPGAAARFLERLDRAGELLEANVSPELVADGLVLAWPRVGDRTAVAVGSRRP